MRVLLNSKSKVFYVMASVALIVLTVNPFTLEALPKNPLVLMASHYSLYFAGALAGLGLFRFNKLLAIPAVIPPIIFHLPYFFVESGVSLPWTFLDYSLTVVGGILLGGSMRQMGKIMKGSLFVLYMIGDTTLAILLILGFPVYSSPTVPFSPYSTTQLVEVSYLMFGIMNAILFGVLGYTLKKLLE